MSGIPLNQCGLSARALNCLTRKGVFETEALGNLSLKEVATWRNVGPKTLNEIEELKRFIKANRLEKFACQEDTVDNSSNILQEKSREMYFKDAISLYKNALSVYNVSELNLSTRTYNALYRAKIVTVLDLINSIGENFRGVHHIGDKAKKEIVESIYQWLETKRSNTLDNDLETVEYFAIISKKLWRIADYSTESLVDWAKKAKLYDAIIAGGYECINVENYRAILEIPELQKDIENLVLAIVPHGIIAAEDLKTKIEELEFDIPVEVLENKFLKDFLSREKAGYCFFYRQSIMSFFQEMAYKDRNYTILYERIQGKTLQNISETFKITKERVRQIVYKTIRKMPLMDEDFFSEPYEYFYLSKKQFNEIFSDADAMSFEYLNLRYRKGRYILDEETIQSYIGVFKKELIAYLEKKKKYEPDKKESFAVADLSSIFQVLYKHQKQPMPLNEFINEYYDYICTSDYSPKHLKISTNTLKNYLRNVERIVFNANGDIRYCLASAAVVWRSIRFLPYENSAISAEIIFNDYLDLMEQEDIRDGYELFFVLKTSQINAIKLNWNDLSNIVAFRKAPTIIVGNGSD